METEQITPTELAFREFSIKRNRIAEAKHPELSILEIINEGKSFDISYKLIDNGILLAVKSCPNGYVVEEIISKDSTEEYVSRRTRLLISALHSRMMKDQLEADPILFNRYLKGPQ